MLELAVFEDVAELRDAVLILAGGAAALVAFIFLLLVARLSLTAYRVVRRHHAAGRATWRGLQRTHVRCKNGKARLPG